MSDYQSNQAFRNAKTVEELAALVEAGFQQLKKEFASLAKIRSFINKRGSLPRSKMKAGDVIFDSSQKGLSIGIHDGVRQRKFRISGMLEPGEDDTSPQFIDLPNHADWRFWENTGTGKYHLYANIEGVMVRVEMLEFDPVNEE